jgi:hypothetical protein
MKPTGCGSRWRLIANVPEQSETAAAREKVVRRGYFAIEVNRDSGFVLSSESGFVART